ncbi:MAG TPA: cytochrome oxidase small assembly protein [Caldimonas sp.]|nr:cytochrome oxidase small assembly protein [Caldimonas sp.]HEX2540843.1 cytochrome oxidase small assembly protein [Caldimonas sp.]
MPDPTAWAMEPRRKSNRRLALVLASIALVFFLGYMLNRAWFAG